MIGESTSDDVLTVAADILGINIPLDFQLHSDQFRHTWYFPEERGLFRTAAFFDATGLLTSLQFKTFDVLDYPVPSLDLFLDNLGVPEYWTVYWERGGLFRIESTVPRT